MLDGLDGINWAQRSHAFGEASDVPALLRAVADGGASADEAISELFNTVWHQGTVYDATAPTVPFLAELAAADNVDVDHRARLLALLFEIGRGAGAWQVHAQTFAQIGSLPVDLPDQLAAKEDWVRASHDAVEREAIKMLDRLDSFPERLWLPVAVLVVVAGDRGRSLARELAAQASERLPTFGAAGMAALAEVLTTGLMSPPRIRQLEALDQDLALRPTGGPGRTVTCQTRLILRRRSRGATVRHAGPWIDIQAAETWKRSSG